MSRNVCTAARGIGERRFSSSLPGYRRDIASRVATAPAVISSRSPSGRGRRDRSAARARKRGSDVYWAMPSPRANGSEPRSRSCGRQPSTVVSTVTTSAAARSAPPAGSSSRPAARRSTSRAGTRTVSPPSPAPCPPSGCSPGWRTRTACPTRRRPWRSAHRCRRGRARRHRSGRPAGVPAWSCPGSRSAAPGAPRRAAPAARSASGRRRPGCAAWSVPRRPHRTRTPRRVGSSPVAPDAPAPQRRSVPGGADRAPRHRRSGSDVVVLALGRRARRPRWWRLSTRQQPRDTVLTGAREPEIVLLRTLHKEDRILAVSTLTRA